ncbi:hypothetical protein Mesil_3483 (plasmid) [Allomeiothermus silvanus DSM 9946]|uniref:Uncharacterized protein n=2 Tax=Allomeiothermus silvanus TaxID=52022 RepID=D7BJD1_ALLS1|nr:hypothetical protein Mesil_3483 [Allomeiothermus silvanus DSM 9946]
MFICGASESVGTGTMAPMSGSISRDRGSVLPPGWQTRLPERRRFQEFAVLEPGGRGRNGPVLVGRLGKERWVLKSSDLAGAANEIIASVVGRSLGLLVPPAMAVDKGGDLWAASMHVFGLQHHPRVGFNDRNPFRFGPDGPADIPNYWPQVALGKLLGDHDRKGGNWGIDQYGQRWDFDFSLSENAHLFIGPDAPDWNHYRREFFREGIEGMQARGISPSALEGFLIPYRALAQSDPEKLYGWTSEVGDLGGLFMGQRPLGPALIEAARANRQAMREALEDLGLD